MPIGDFIALLTENGIQLLADVRTVPRSRYNPQFNRDTLPDSLRAAGIEHVHMPELGGLRHPNPDSPNTAWRNDSFRGYADYMQTPEFAAAIDKLIDLAQARNLVVMCAESVPWRCHRNLIADALAARGITVTHIMSPGVTKPHTLTPFAEVSGTRVLYPAAQPGLDLG
jgi:uncharacterized protein (DUF488 family)